MIFIGLLLFSGNPPQDNDLQKYESFKKADDFTGYANNIFDSTDAHPARYIFKADSILQTFWRQPVNNDEKLSYYELLINFGYLLLQQGRVSASSAYYELALKFYLDHALEDTALQTAMNFEEYVCKPLGNNYTRIGAFGKAMQIQNMAISSALENRKNKILPGLYVNLAATHFWAKDYHQSLEACNEGVKYAVGDGRYLILLYNLKTDAFLELNVPDSAIYWNDRALDIANTLHEGKTTILSGIYSSRAAIFQKIGRHRDAFAAVKRAWMLADNLSTREKAKIANDLGGYYLSDKDTLSAQQYFNTALSSFPLNAKGLFPDFTVTSALFGKAKSFAGRNADSAVRYYELAVLNDYYAQQLLTGALNTQSALYSNEQASEEAILYLHHLYNLNPDPFYLKKSLWLTELSKGRKVMYEQHRTNMWLEDSITGKNALALEQLNKDIHLLSQTADAREKEIIQSRIRAAEYDLNLKENLFVRQFQVPDYELFLKRLDEKRRSVTCISYFLAGDKCYSVLVDSVGFHQNIANSRLLEDVANFTSRYFSNFSSFTNAPEDYFSQSKELLESLIPADYRRTPILISPDGILFSLPFEALSTDAVSPDFLGAATAITYSYSLLQNMLADTVSSGEPSLEVFSFEKSHLGFPGLSSAQTERNFLNKNFSAKVFDATQTEDSSFVHSLLSRNVIHLASHAVANQKEGQPFLVLKNKLYLSQLQYITAQTPLVVLAACETGSGVLQTGEGMESLGKALMSKGVRSIISTRWEADDQATSELIQLFYTHLKTNKTPALALQSARKEYLEKHTSIADKNPWLWAGLIYQGLDEPIEIAEPDGSWFSHPVRTMLLAIGLCVGVGLLAIIYIRRRGRK